MNRYTYITYSPVTTYIFEVLDFGITVREYDLVISTFVYVKNLVRVLEYSQLRSF